MRTSALSNGVNHDGHAIAAVSALIEVATGLGLFFSPEVVAQLLLGGQLENVGVVLGRVTGIALLCLGIACWPYAKTWSAKGAPLTALAIYNILAAAYLFGIAGTTVGALFWPAVVLHAIVGVALAVFRLRAGKALV
jgi:hypothetical protein